VSDSLQIYTAIPGDSESASQGNAAQKSGDKYQRRCKRVLRECGYEPFEGTEKPIGYRPGKFSRVRGKPGVYKPDIALCMPMGHLVVSCKNNSTDGSAEDKMSREVEDLLYLLAHRWCDHVLLVLGGDHWTRKEHYLSEEFRIKENLPVNLEIIPHEEFVRRAEAHQLVTLNF
jgi:hypothetical protein